MDATKNSPQRRGEEGGSAEAKRSSLRNLSGLGVSAVKVVKLMVASI